MPCSPSHSLTLDTPVGHINIESCEDGIHSVSVPSCTVKDPEAPIEGKVSISDGKADDSTLSKCVEWFTSYFKGNILDVNFPLCSQGITGFRQDAYKALSAIKPGDSMTYSEFGRKLGKSGCARAVGSAMGKNRHLILVPCHRLVHSSGKMTKCATNGYLKPALLTHEASIASASPSNGASKPVKEEKEEEVEEEDDEKDEEDAKEEVDLKPEPKVEPDAEPKGKSKRGAKKTETKAEVKTENGSDDTVQVKAKGKKAAKEPVAKEPVTKEKAVKEPVAKGKAAKEKAAKETAAKETAAKEKAAPPKRSCCRKRKLAS